MRQLYVHSIKTILHSLGDGDVLVAGWINDHPEGELELPINQSFPPFCPETDNPLVVGTERARADSVLDSLRGRIADSLERLLSSPHRAIMQTAILQSLGLAQRVFAAYDGIPKSVILMSDMIEESENHNFLKEHLTARGSQAIINELRGSRRLPNLQGVRVVVLGATAGNNEADREIRDFWFSLFRAAGAELRPADYGGPLIRFDVPHAPPTCP